MNVSPRIPVLPPPPVLRFVRLTQIDPLVLLDHMSDRRIARHLPLLGTGWDLERIAAFVRVKEQCWERDGLGHWAILANGVYAGWGGFQKEGDDCDFGLVLRVECFSLGQLIFAQAIAWLSAHRDIGEVTFLLPPSRSRRVPERLGARHRGVTTYAGMVFTKWSMSIPPRAAGGKPS
jgi:hypothetical protein